MKRTRLEFNHLVILLFVIVCVYLSINARKQIKRYEDERIELQLTEYRIEKYIYRYKLELSSMENILENIVLVDGNNSEFPIQDLINTPKLIYRVSSRSCSPCVDRDIQRIKELGKVIGPEKILIISDYENSRSLNILSNSQEVLSPCFNFTGKLNLTIAVESDLKKAPFFFILDEELRVRFPFLGDEYPELNDIYFERIKNYFMNTINNGE